MRKWHIIAVAIVLLVWLGMDRVFSAENVELDDKAAKPVVTDGKYVMIGWNDLGMHCIGPRFAEMCILPPFNNLNAIVIRRGSEPQIVGKGATIAYSLVNNTTVKGKTDFWSYEKALFGVNLKPGIGLTGNGLSGTMDAGYVHKVTGVPALPYNDALVWNPLQKANLTLLINGRQTKVKTQIVVPVSDEMNCAKCHAAGQDAAGAINTGTVEGNILTLHDQKVGTKLMNNRPVLCAGCHADAALNMAGKNGVESLSLAMHSKHSTVSDMPNCYDCHPGANTQCNRSNIRTMGPNGTDPRCVNCHGDLIKMAGLLKAGRQPWVQEPACTDCHKAAQYSTGTVLYRNSLGHGGVPCEACHNSPHAWWPSLKAADNLQPKDLQNNNRSIGLNSCSVCHTDGRKGKQPPHQDD